MAYFYTKKEGWKNLDPRFPMGVNTLKKKSRKVSNQLDHFKTRADDKNLELSIFTIE